jgi:hypothetical protein
MPVYTITAGPHGAAAPAKTQFRRDTGLVVQVTVGLAYELSAAEFQRISRYTELEPGGDPSTPEPWKPTQLQIRDLQDVDPGPPSHGDVLVWDGVSSSYIPGVVGGGGGGGSSVDVIPFQHLTAPLVAGVGTSFFLLRRSFLISKVYASLDIAPQNGQVVVDVNRNGSTIFTTQGNRPSIGTGQRSSVDRFPNVASLVSGDELTVDRDEVGSGANGLHVYIVGAWS